MGFTYFYWVLLGFAELFLRSRCTFFYLCFLLGWNAAPAGSVCCFFRVSSPSGFCCLARFGVGVGALAGEQQQLGAICQPLIGCPRRPTGGATGLGCSFFFSIVSLFFFVCECVGVCILFAVFTYSFVIFFRSF